LFWEEEEGEITYISIDLHIGRHDLFWEEGTYTGGYTGDTREYMTSNLGVHVRYHQSGNILDLSFNVSRVVPSTDRITPVKHDLRRMACS
jgi:hypothetical protein